MDVELSRSFNLCFKTLRICGWWQSGNQSWLYLIYGFVSISIVVETYILCQILYIANVGNLKDFVDTLGLFLTFLATQSKTINFLYKIRRIKQLVRDLDELLKFTQHTLSVKRGHIKRRVDVIYRLYLAYWMLGIMSCTAFAISILIYQQLPYKLWFPFDIETSSAGFWSAATYTVVQSYIATAVAIALDIMPVIFIGFAVGLIEEFSGRLENIKNKQELVKCVEVHNKIKNYIKGIQDNFASVILIQGFMSSIILCVCAFSLSTVSWS